jgi:1-deoxy-D-xylulose-5-phosphate synthase
MTDNGHDPGHEEATAPRLLDAIDTPADLHGLDDEQLQQVAQEMRTYIIDTIGEIGGHFGANLGTCELAVALHSLLDSPRDKILWDVGHQAYPHKILTGRREGLSTIRQYEGLAPFCSIFESEHDIMGAGHASTSIGYAVGLKEAMRKGIGEDGKVAAVIGDGALTGGVAYEALHAAGGLQAPLVIVLNDNGMSISPNVGALSRYFNRVRLNPRLYHAREGVEDRLTKLPLGLGKRIERLGPEIKSAIKAYWAPGLFFEELDLAYMGVIDGHDVHALREALREAFAADRPVVVHIHTVKGKGFAPAEDGGLEGMEKWHAAKPKSIVNGEPTSTQKPAASSSASATPEEPDMDPGSLPRPGAAGLMEIRESDSPEAIAPERLEKPPAVGAPPQYTQVFGNAIVAEAKRDQRVIGITAAMAGGTGLQKLADEAPEQYYDVGIAEQNAVLLASGLAIQGAKPVCAIYSTFLQRAYDQIIHDVCLQALDVTFAMDRAGLVGDDGPTHHGAFDVSYFRPIPNVVLMAPRDEAMLVHMLRTAIAHDGPAALRYPRGAAEGIELPTEPMEIPVGSGELLQSGERVALLGYGYGVSVALGAAKVLAAHGLEATVADARFAKPLDAELLERLALEHDLVVTIEENVLPGGFGSAVLERLEDAFADRPADRARVLRIGLPDRYVTHGKPALLREEVGLTGQSVADRVLAALRTGEPALS